MKNRPLLGFAAATVIVFGAIRLGIRLLQPYAEPPRPSSTVVSRSSSSPAMQPLDRHSAKRDAGGKLLFLAREANARHATKVATDAYDAERALSRDDCPAATTAAARAVESAHAEPSLEESAASAARAVSAFCELPP